MKTIHDLDNFRENLHKFMHACIEHREQDIVDGNIELGQLYCDLLNEYNDLEEKTLELKS